MSAALTAELRPKTAVVRRAVIRGFFNFCLAGEEGTLTLELGMQLSGLVLRDCGYKNDSKVVQHHSTMSDCSWPRVPFRPSPRKQSLTGLLRQVIDSFGESWRLLACGQKPSFRPCPFEPLKQVPISKFLGLPKILLAISHSDKFEWIHFYENDRIFCLSSKSS